jgi:hypothetical protein
VYPAPHFLIQVIMYPHCTGMPQSKYVVAWLNRANQSIGVNYLIYCTG